MKRVGTVTAAVFFWLTFSGGPANAALYTSYTFSGTVKTHNGETPTTRYSVTLTAYPYEQAINAAYFNSGANRCERRCQRATSATTVISVPVDASGNYSFTGSFSHNSCKLQVGYNCPVLNTEGGLGSLACDRCDYWKTTTTVLNYSQVTLTYPGSETTSKVHEVTTPTGTFPFNFTNAPEFTSPNGQWDVRRVGPWTPNPIIDVEGFDPENATSSSDRLGLFGCSMVQGSDRCAAATQCLVSTAFDGTTNGVPKYKCEAFPEQFVIPTRWSSAYGTNSGSLLHYALANNYTLWEVLSGPHGGDTIIGNPVGSTNGGAYQAAWIMKRISDLTKARFGSANRGIFPGGYSMGGPVVRVGLYHWCNGDWASLGLPAGCNEVLGWWGGDAPFQGAYAGGLALHRYLNDPNAGGKASLPASVEQQLKSVAASELLKNWVDSRYYSCNTNCDDLGGCDSWEIDFKQGGCSVNWDRYYSYMGFQGSSFPYRVVNGVQKTLPAVGWAASRAPGTIPTATESKYVLLAKVDINDVGDHRMYLNTAGPVQTGGPAYNEKEAGSTINSARLVSGLTGCSYYPILGIDTCLHYTVTLYGNDPQNSYYRDIEGTYVGINGHMSYIPANSSLDRTGSAEANSQWSDYTYYGWSAPHFYPVDPAAGRMFLGWADALLKNGRTTQPTCSADLTLYKGKRAACYTATTITSEY